MFGAVLAVGRASNCYFHCVDCKPFGFGTNLLSHNLDSRGTYAKNKRIHTIYKGTLYRFGIRYAKVKE